LLEEMEEIAGKMEKTWMGEEDCGRGMEDTTNRNDTDRQREGFSDLMENAGSSKKLWASL